MDIIIEKCGIRDTFFFSTLAGYGKRIHSTLPKVKDAFELTSQEISQLNIGGRITRKMSLDRLDGILENISK